MFEGREKGMGTEVLDMIGERGHPSAFPTSIQLPLLFLQRKILPLATLFYSLIFTSSYRIALHRIMRREEK